MKTNNDFPAVTQEAEPTADETCDICQDEKCGKKKPGERISAYEKTRRAVYATGNRWAIENFHATHD